jgi:hypothetical protein
MSGTAILNITPFNTEKKIIKLNGMVIVFFAKA